MRRYAAEAGSAYGRTGKEKPDHPAVKAYQRYGEVQINESVPSL